jgi:hypothetical protein
MARQVEADSSYSDRLLKLVPAEFVTAYVAATQAVQSQTALRQPVLLTLVVVFALLIPIYLFKFQGVTSRMQIAMTTLSFLIWTYTLGDAFQTGPWMPTDLFIPEIASIMLVLWTVIVPLFVKQP